MVINDPANVSFYSFQFAIIVYCIVHCSCIATLYRRNLELILIEAYETTKLELNKLL